MATLSGFEAVKLAIDAAKPVEQQSDAVGSPPGDSHEDAKPTTAATPPESRSQRSQKYCVSIMPIYLALCGSL